MFNKESNEIENCSLTQNESKKISSEYRTEFVDHVRTVFGCLINIVSSLSIVFLNKYIFTKCQIESLMLTGIHMLFTTIGLIICLKLKTFERKSVPIIKVLPLSIGFCVFVVFTNLSLEYNTVGTYQLAKILITPGVVIISSIYYQTKYSPMVLCSLIPVIVGIGIHSLNDLKLMPIGTLVAGIGILSGSIYQVWIGEKHKELKMNSQQLLFYQSPLSGLLLIPLILMKEKLPIYETNEQMKMSIIAVTSSGFVSFVVNLSTYWIIKNTSSLTYTMVGHLKTIFILIGSFIIFNEKLILKQIIGIILTLFGVFSYTFLRMSELNQFPWSRPLPTPVSSA